MEALNIAKPFDSICSACSREGMPAKVRMTLRTLLLSTSEVHVPVDAPVDPREDARDSGATLPANDRPLCAGVGDADSLVWACWSCLTDLCAKKPRMPLNALADAT